MNCKQGDMALIIRSATGVTAGWEVTCLNFLGEVEGCDGSDRWEIDRKIPYLKKPSGEEVWLAHICDRNLMPIGTTETEKTKERESVYEI